MVLGSDKLVTKKGHFFIKALNFPMSHPLLPQTGCWLARLPSIRNEALCTGKDNLLQEKGKMKINHICVSCMVSARFMS